MAKKIPSTISKVENIKELFYQIAEKYETNPAFTLKKTVDGKVEYTDISYREYLNLINALGTAVSKLPLTGNRFAVIGKNSFEWTLSHFSSLLGNNVSVPLDKDLPIDELENSLVRSRANTIYFDEAKSEIIEEIRERGKTELTTFICMTKKEGYPDIPSLLEEGRKMLEEGDTSFTSREIDSFGMGILLFTSGTTDRAKAVMLNQNGIAMNAYDLLLVEPLYSDDVNIALLPFHHIFGSTCLVVMMAAGVKTVFCDGLRYVQANLKEYHVSVFVGVPALVEKMYQAIERGIEKKGKTKLVKNAKKISSSLLKLGIDMRRVLFKEVIREMGNMRFVISGGAPLDKAISKSYNDLGMSMVQGYGLTETSPVIASETPFDIKPGSVGKPMRSVQAKFINPDEDGIGELIVKGPNVMLGYYEDEEKTREVLKDGWFYTGDLGKFDEEGSIFLTGRKKDMIVLNNGKKVFPEEIEQLFNKIDLVEESFVFALPKEGRNLLSVEIKYDQKVAKEKYLTENESDLREKILEKVREINKLLPPYKHIKNVVLTKKEFIKTTTQKIKRNEEVKRILSIMNKNESAAEAL